MELTITHHQLRFQTIDSSSDLSYNKYVDWSITMKQYQFGTEKYTLLENYKDGFDKEAVEHLYTDYFEPYDYILGDWSYGKLRLKGFYRSSNAKKKAVNDFSKKEQYIKENCAYDCKYFVLEKKGSE